MKDAVPTSGPLGHSSSTSCTSKALTPRQCPLSGIYALDVPLTLLQPKKTKKKEKKAIGCLAN